MVAISKEQIEIEYKRYADLCRFTNKKVPMFEEYVLKRGLRLEDYLTKEELEAIGGRDKIN